MAWSFSRQQSTKPGEITNRLAPEHLTVDSASDLEWVAECGLSFVGDWSAQPMGDYISGPNHTLPTGGMARVRGGLSVNDFVKLITVQEYSASGLLRNLGPQAALLADAEGLSGARRSDPRSRVRAIQAQRQRQCKARKLTVTLQPTPRARVQAMKEYHPPLGSRDALRLDFNENTLACSPKVREVLGRDLRRVDLTRYPEREPVEAHRCRASWPRARSKWRLDQWRRRSNSRALRDVSRIRTTSFCCPFRHTRCMRSMHLRPMRASVTVQAARRSAVSLRPPARRHHSAHQDHRHRESQQPFGIRGHARTNLELAQRAPHAVILVDEAYFHFHAARRSWI